MATQAMTRVSGIVVELSPGRTSSGSPYLTLKVQEEGKRYATTVRDWSGLLTEVRQGQQITLDVTEITGQGKSGPVTYRNAARLIAAVDPTARAEGDPHTTSSPIPSASSEGQAWGAAQHAASRLLSAWVLKHGVPPNHEQAKALTDTLREMTEETFRIRQGGVA